MYTITGSTQMIYHVSPFSSKNAKNSKILLFLFVIYDHKLNILGFLTVGQTRPAT